MNVAPARSEDITAVTRRSQCKCPEIGACPPPPERLQTDIAFVQQPVTGISLARHQRNSGNLPEIPVWAAYAQQEALRSRASAFSCGVQHALAGCSSDVKEAGAQHASAEALSGSLP